MKLREEIISTIDICFPDEMDSSMYHPNAEVAVDKILQLFKTFLEENKLEELSIQPLAPHSLNSQCRECFQKYRALDQGFNQAIKEQFEKNMEEL